MRVLIIVDNTLTAEAIRREMRHAPTCQVIGYVNGRRPCALTIADASPDLVIVDDAGDERTTLHRIRDVRNAVPAAKVVLLTTRMDGERLEEALAAGIDAAISKAAPPSSVGLLIREVAAGNVFHAFARQATIRRAAPYFPTLTTRELEILRRVAAGASNSAIARELFVTEQTVKFHLSNIYRKLGVSNRTEASRRAQLAGLLEAPSEDAPVSDLR